ncbi:hypothetical protein, partial [Nonomuraea angiospora]
MESTFRSAEELPAAMRAGEVTSAELTDEAIARIVSPRSAKRARTSGRAWRRSRTPVTAFKSVRPVINCLRRVRVKALLTLTCAGQFMVLLDNTIVGAALPDMQQ